MQAEARYQKYNPFRTPDWRFVRVLQLCDRYPVPKRASHRDDEMIQKARRFLLHYRARDEADREELLWENPGLYYAYKIHERMGTDPETGLILQARLLARQSPEQIAEGASLMPETVFWYEAMFFNVSDYMHQRDWITVRVLLPAWQKQQNSPQMLQQFSSGVFSSGEVALPFLDGTLKMFAFFGGPHIVDLMICGFQNGKPLKSPDDLPRWLDENWAVAIKRRSLQSAMLGQINKFNLMDLFNVHARIIELERSEEGADKVRGEHERNVKAMLDSLPWTVGTERMPGGEGLSFFDTQGAELRDSEVLRLTSGEPTGKLRDDIAAADAAAKTAASNAAAAPPAKPGEP